MMRRKPNMSLTQTPGQVQSVEQRLKNFDEVDLGYTEEQAKQEAERCLNCPDRYCAAHCPAHNYIPEFIAEIRAGRFDRAWELLSRTNPMMEISGRVCPCEQQCEVRCTRAIKGEPVNIGKLERFIADWHRSNTEPKAPAAASNGKKVAVVGAGPAGMTCALSLAECGFKVSVYEKEDHAGGVPSWGIPAFVLPRNLLDRMSSQLEQHPNTDIHLNTTLGKDIALSELLANNDAVFLATGADQSVALDIPGSDCPQVLQAADYLKHSEQFAGKQVLVIGGGNTAIDAARTALRRGAESVAMVYRRTEADMPATKEEISIAKQEGVQIKPLLSPTRFVLQGSKLTGLECSAMMLTAPDYPGGRNNVAPNGQTELLNCDLAILALGFNNQPVEGVDCDQRNRIIVGKDFSTGTDRVYAGGDAVTGPATFMKAVAAGKDAAAAIFGRFGEML
jgi:glutamate synthase (NADPH) small chain